MENNNRNKALFYLQYQFKYVCCEGIGNSLWYLIPNGAFGTQINLGNLGERSISDAPPLELTSLSKITDEDAIEVGRLFSDDEDIDFGKEYYLMVGKRACNYFPNIKTVLSAITMTFIYQYLQSKGYALPWMGLWVDDLVNRGWIKLKSE